MSATGYQDLKRHIGHRIEVVEYGRQNVSVECVDCNEVLLDEDDNNTLLCVFKDCNNIQSEDSEYCEEHQNGRD